MSCRNNVPQLQKAYQADPRPVFQRGPRSKLYFGLYLTLFGVGMYGTTLGFYNMAVVSVVLSFPFALLQFSNRKCCASHRARSARRSKRHTLAQSARAHSWLVTHY